MEIMENILLIIGFIVIIKSSNVLVDSAVSIAYRMHIPKMVVALTIVAFGTCIPEVAISFKSIFTGNGGMALANVMGSCVVNVLLIVGLACLIKPIKIKRDTIKKQLPILLIITIGLVTLIVDKIFLSKLNSLGRVDGFALLLLFGIFIYYISKVTRKNRELLKEKAIKYPLIPAIIYLIISLYFILLSSDMIVNSSIMVASNLGISQKVVTLVVIVIGSSLPELVMTITAARKNEFEMAIGNIIGTNIFNIGVVLGLPLTIYGYLPISSFNIIDIVFFFLSSFILFFFARSEKKLSRVEGLAMLSMFLMYYTYILFIE